MSEMIKTIGGKKLLADYNTEGKKLALQEVYCVKYGDTNVTYDQLYQLMKDGKVVMCQYDDMSYASVCLRNSEKISFWTMTNSHGVRYMDVYKDGHWNTGYVSPATAGMTAAVLDSSYSPRHYVYWGHNWATHGKTMWTHRGWTAGGAKDNGWKAFKAVKTSGWNAIECDLFATKDNKLVCSHDATFTADDGTTVTIGNYTLDELQAQFLYDEYPPVSLDQLMGLCQLYSFRLVLDKTENIYKNNETIEYCRECIAAHSMWDQVCIPVSYNSDSANEAFKANFSGCSARVIVQFAATENLETGRQQAESLITTYGAKECYISTSPDRFAKDDIIAMTKKFKPGMMLDIWMVNNTSRYLEWCDKASAWTTDSLLPYQIQVLLTNN